MVGAVQIQTDRHPVSIRYHHNLGSLAHLGFSNPVSPFLAGTNRPSRKAWDHSIFSSASIRLNSARQIRSHVPSSDHCFNRRQQVVGEPYCRGMSAQVQPVFNTYRIPFRVFLGSAGGRPGPGFGLGAGAQSQPIVRLSAHVSYSYFHFTLEDHVFEIACKDEPTKGVWNHIHNVLTGKV